MSSQIFRHRDHEEWRAKKRPERQTQGEETDPRGGQAGHEATPPPSSPCTPSNAPLFPEAIELGSAASLFRIAESQRHPNPQAALEVLRGRMKKTLAENKHLSVPARTTLRDWMTTTDSLWLPTLKAIAVLAACVLVAAGIYGLVEWLQPVSSEPAAVAGTAIAHLLSF